ncbi:MAG: hypothetical protein ABI480_00160 [Chitinophagaceae bacterium]
MGISWKWGAEEKRKGDEGFNNAGILTFSSHTINSFVRELFQNSNDAKQKGAKKVSIKIEQKNIDRSDIPEFRSYRDILDAVEKSHPKQKRFYKSANSLLNNIRIPFLVYSDYQTIGLTGKESDSNSSFMACVLSEGISAKESDTAGGSYGIGKNAIYGLSALRTVFYSSMNTSENCIFQGVAKLASYRMHKVNHEGRIYLGEGEERLSVRKQKDIPKIFKRTEPGLSQFVMGVEIKPGWHIDFTKAILRNYWMLLMQDGLEVELLESGKSLITINSKNIDTLLKQYFENYSDEHSLYPKGNPYLFYEAFKEGERIEMDIPFIGKCSFYYKNSDRGENNIAYLRNGMVIYSDIEKRLIGATVTGVFKCESDAGNEILRTMEPPKHDSFEPEVLESNHNDLTKIQGQKILNSIKKNIRDTIKSLIEKFKEVTETPIFLTELFEDLQKSIVSGNKGARKNESSQTETIYRKAVEDEIAISLHSEQENSYVSNVNGTTTGPGGTPLKEKKKTDTPKNKEKKNVGPGNRTAKKYPIKSRIYYLREKNGKNIYKAIISSEAVLGDTELGLAQYADSGSDIAFELSGITDADGSKISFNEVKDTDGLVSEYKFFINVKEGKNIFFLEVYDNYKSAFIING